MTAYRFVPVDINVISTRTLSIPACMVKYVLIVTFGTAFGTTGWLSLNVIIKIGMQWFVNEIET